MKKFYSFCIFCVVFSLQYCLGQETKTISGYHYIKEGGEWYLNDLDHKAEYKILNGDFVLRFTENTSEVEISNFERDYNISNVTAKKYGYHSCTPNIVNDIDSLLNLAEILANLTFIEYLSVNSEVILLSTPNDALYNTQQWYANLMRLPQAWAMEDGSNSPIVIGIIDDGINWQHEDLGFGPDGYSNIYYNSGDTWADPNDPTSGDGIDNDNNGYIDDYIGWNFGYSNNDTRSNINFNHGTWVAGIASAKRNNSIGSAGIAGGTGNGGVKLIPIASRPSIGAINHSAIADIIDYAVDNGCRVINISMSFGPDSLIQAALDNAYAQNVVVVCSAGNSPDEPVIRYPASYIYTIAVGGIDQSGNRNPGSSFGTRLDISASSFDNWGPGTTSTTYTGSGGTSGAAPIISGIAALMLTVNPDLGPRQVKEIITAKAIKSGNHNYFYDLYWPGKSLDLGYGVVDAEACLIEASNFLNPSYDLYMRDRYDDAGRNEGYTWTWDFDASPDIWMRNNDDYDINNRNTHIDEYIEYDPNGMQYVYVRVGNKGSIPSDSNATITLYQSWAGSTNAWPEGWDGSLGFGNGAPIDTQYVPVLEPGESVVLKFPWAIPINGNHCLLARINGGSLTGDPILHTIGGNDGIDNWKNNNIALNNVIVIDLQPNLPQQDISLYEEYMGTNIYFGNSSDIAEPLDLTFRVPRFYEGNNLLDEAEVTLHFDDVSWNAILPQINGIPGIVDVDADLKKVRIKDTVVTFHQLNLPTSHRCKLFLGINFLIDESSNKEKFGYHVIQKNSTISNEFGELWTGGVHMIIQKPERYLFQANAGNDEEVREDETVIIEANDIGEGAIYNWYDEKGNLIHTGKSFTLSSNINKTLNLEVIAENDLFKDYDSLRITVKDYYIDNVSPNPFDASCSVNYKIKEGTNAVLSFVPINGGNTVASFVINDLGITNLNTTSLPLGYYQLLLISNGEIKDAKTIFKN